MDRCEGCGRHVRGADASCPFCAKPMRRGLAAAVLVTAALAVAACDDKVEKGKDGPGRTPSSVQPVAAVYGGPPPRPQPVETPDAASTAPPPDDAAATGDAAAAAPDAAAKPQPTVRQMVPAYGGPPRPTH